MRQGVGVMRGSSSPSVLLAYATFVLLGISAGTGGVVLLAQIGDYHVDRATIGITFATGSLGFVLAGLHTGPLMHRYGARAATALGAAAYVVAGLYLATRPSFLAFVLVQILVGYGSGLLDTAPNAYLAPRADAPVLLNRLHAFFGVGALLGPVLATWIIGTDTARWTLVWLVLALACVPLLVGFLVLYPGAEPHEPVAAASTDPATPPHAPGLLGPALREPGVLLGAAMLAVYVGLEIGMGTWGYSYLVQDRGLTSVLAGYAVSGYWLGLTLGRFLISPLATRFGASTVAVMYGCLAGVTVAVTLVWIAPIAVIASAALVLLGFCLGPIFPTTMAVAPKLAPARLGSTAIGVMNAGSLVGGAGLPWLAGILAQGAGIGTLIPFTLALAVLQFAVWRPIAQRIRVPQPAVDPI